MAVAFEVDVAALRRTLAAEHERGIREQRFVALSRMRTLENLIEKARSECQLVALTLEAERLHFAQRQQPTQVVAAVESSRALNGAATAAASGCSFVSNI